MRGTRLGWTMCVAVAGAILAAGLFNAFQHESLVGYDSYEHLGYAQALADGHLPRPQDTHEFFSAPLSYLPASIALAAGADFQSAAKVWQIVNAAILALLLATMWRLIIVAGGGWLAVLGALVAIGIQPTLYRGFAMARPEPLLAWLAMLSLLCAARLCRSPDVPVWRYAMLGTLLGLCALTRQWGVFLVPGVMVLGTLSLIRHRVSLRAASLRVGVSVLAFGLVCGWFYGSLQVRFGSMMTFNRPTQLAVHQSYPLSFYVDLPIAAMITQPVQNNLRGHYLPLLYADFWGDYWCNFTVYARNRAGNLVQDRRVRPDQWKQFKVAESNYDSMSRYMGVVNAIAIVPTTIGLAALAWSLRRRAADSPAIALCGWTVVLTFLGFTLFVMAHPVSDGDTIKAVYMLQAVAPLAAAAGLWLDDLHRRHARRAWLVLAILAAFAGVVWPMCLTNFV